MKISKSARTLQFKGENLFAWNANARSTKSIQTKKLTFKDFKAT